MKRRGLSAITGCALMLLASVSGVRPAEAATTECIGQAPAGITVPGSLTVPDGQYCILHEATIMGDVTVFGSLSMESGRVAGSVTGDEAQIALFRSRISKGVTTTGPRAEFFAGPAFAVCDTQVVGNVTVSNGPNGHVTSIGGFCQGGAITKIAGSLHLLNNAPEHGLAVTNVQISGDLVCQASSNPDLKNVTVAGTIQNDCD